MSETRFSIVRCDEFKEPAPSTEDTAWAFVQAFLKSKDPLAVGPLKQSEIPWLGFFETHPDETWQIKEHFAEILKQSGFLTNEPPAEFVSVTEKCFVDFLRASEASRSAAKALAD